MEDAQGPVSPAEQLEAARKVAAILEPLGIELLALGSLAFVLLGGAPRPSKDVDVHPFPIRGTAAWKAYYETLSSAIEQSGGTVSIAPDGAAVVARVPVGSGLVPVELIEGREDFVEPAVLADAVRNAKRTEAGILVPSPAHLFVMKVEAAVDRRGPRRLEFLEDAREIAETFLPAGEFDEEEVRRLIALRPARKRPGMENETSTISASVASAVQAGPAGGSPRKRTGRRRGKPGRRSRAR